MKILFTLQSVQLEGSRLITTYETAEFLLKELLRYENLDMDSPIGSIDPIDLDARVSEVLEEDADRMSSDVISILALFGRLAKMGVEQKCTILFSPISA